MLEAEQRVPDVAAGRPGQSGGGGGGGGVGGLGGAESALCFAVLFEGGGGGVGGSRKPPSCQGPPG